MPQGNADFQVERTPRKAVDRSITDTRKAAVWSTRWQHANALDCFYEIGHMEAQLQYALAAQELRRLAGVPFNFAWPIPTALAMVELLDAYLALPDSRRNVRALATNFRRMLCDALDGLRLEQTLRDGKTLYTELTVKQVNGGALYSLYNAAFIAIRTAGTMTAAAWAIRVEANRFAALIAPDFPTLAELLVASQNGDLRVERPDAAAILRDASRRRPS